MTPRMIDVRHSLGVRVPVGLRRRATRAMPLVWGFVKPTILLPRDCDAWPAERRRAVLAHELGHVALDDENADVREWIVRTLATVDDERTVQIFIDRLDDEDADRPPQGPERGRSGVSNRLADDSAEVREWAGRALGVSGDRRALQAVSRLG